MGDGGWGNGDGGWGMREILIGGACWEERGDGNLEWDEESRLPGGG